MSYRNPFLNEIPNSNILNLRNNYNEFKRSNQELSLSYLPNFFTPRFDNNSQFQMIDVHTQTESSELEQDKNNKIQSFKSNKMESLNRKNSLTETQNDERKEKIEQICSNIGRKRKGIVIEVKHSKDSKDNIIRKIKTYLLQNLLNWINYSLNKEDKILKIENIINLNLNRDFNDNIMKKKLIEIFSNKISKKYTSIKEENKLNYNKKIFDRNKKEKRNKLMLAKLNLTYGQCFNISKTGKIDEELKKEILEYVKDEDEKEKEEFLDNFLKGFKDKNDFIKEIISKEGIVNDKNKYIKNLEIFCSDYNNWYLSPKALEKKLNQKK